jgi:hypothetical protein
MDTEFFLRLAWDPHSWKATNTYDLLEEPIIRDFGATLGSKITSILAEYYRLNFRRKPEHIGFHAANLFSHGEAEQRIRDWRNLAARADAVAKTVPPEARDAFFELVEYPVKAAAQVNEKFLAPGNFASAQGEIDRLTAMYNNQVAGGKWRLMMSANPRGQMDLQDRDFSAASNSVPAVPKAGHHMVLDAAGASEFIPGRDARWQKIAGLGYNGDAVSVFPTTVSVRATPETISAESPCLVFRIKLQTAGDWEFTIRALPTFSVETGQPQRCAIALDNEKPRIVALPLSHDERNRTWQENVLRNAALASSIVQGANPGQHVLRIWMVDPGIVLDAIEVTEVLAPATTRR